MFRGAVLPAERVEPAHPFCRLACVSNGFSRTTTSRCGERYAAARRVPEVAADVTQQAFLIAAERLGDITPGSERAFLMATALRLAISSSRRARRWS